MKTTLLPLCNALCEPAEVGQLVFLELHECVKYSEIELFFNHSFATFQLNRTQTLHLAINTARGELICPTNLI
jgi:hypothetical protein